MYGSPTMPKDLNLPFPSESDLHHHHQMSSGLLRYRSAPSTLLGDVCEEFLPHRSSSEEAESMFQRFMGNNHLGDKQGVGSGQRSTAQFMPSSMKEEVAARAAVTSAAAPQMLFQPQQQQPFPNLSAAAPAPTTAPNLIRHSSSPAGLFSQLNVENGEYYRGRLKGQMSFPSRQGSAGFMALISEDGEENADDGGPVQNGIARSYIPGYPLASWEDTVLLSESFSAARAKRGRDPSLPENGNLGGHQLTQHLSLPKSSTDMGVETLLQFQDAVPCMVRAKRGCATHPRSIAERVRRTKISERMRKLQELVPNMDKQTSTADMLDLAVEYIKDLQKSVQTLTDGKSKCTCTK